MIKSVTFNGSIYQKPKLFFSSTFLLPINAQINKESFQADASDLIGS